MSNTMTNLLQLWLAKAFTSNAVLRNTCNFMKYVSRDFDRKPQEKGDRVKIPLPAAKTVSDVTPAMTPPTPSDTSIDKVEILLSQWKYASFALTDQEMLQINAGDFFVPMNVEACMVAIVEGINAYLHTKTHGSTGFFGFVGTAGTNPFASNSDCLADAQEVMTNNKSPLSPRVAIINAAAQKAAQKLAEFKDVSQMGNDSVRRYGMLPPVNGFDPYVDQQVPTHTAGTGSGYLINGSGMTAGSTSITVDTGSGTILAGDIVTFAGVSGTYNVVTALASNVFTIYPGLASTVADNAAVTLKASHAVNVAFHPAAVQLVTRPLMAAVQSIAPGLQGSNLIAQADMLDPESRILVRASIYQGWGMAACYFDALYGGDVVRPEMGLRIAG